jgi:hypothetical protein
VNKEALDARADEVLAGLAKAREGGGGTRALIRDAGGRLAEQVRVQFPGLDGDLARGRLSKAELLELAGAYLGLVSEAVRCGDQVARVHVNDNGSFEVGYVLVGTYGGGLEEVVRRAAWAETTLPAYSGPNTKCPKCRAEVKGSSFKPADSYTGSYYKARVCIPGEALERRCRDCDYRWYEACADAPEPSAGAAGEVTGR